MAAILLTEAGFAPSSLPSVPSQPDSDSSPTNLSFQTPKLAQLPVNLVLSSNPTRRYFLDGPVSCNVYSSALDSCQCLSLGRQIHAHALKTEFYGYEYLGSKLMQMYGRCGSVDEAVLLFEKMPLKNIYSWVGILTVCADHGYFNEALSLFLELQYNDIGLDFFVFPVVLKSCGSISALELGRQLHGFVTKKHFVSNTYVCNALIDMYGKCGMLSSAKKVLDGMLERDCISCNSILSSFIAHGMIHDALEYMENMWLSGNPSPNLSSWNAVISGLSQNGFDKEAVDLLYRMQAVGFQPNARTLASVLPACSGLRMLSLGKEIHGYVMRHGFMSNPFVANGLLDVHRRCADMENALKIFLKFTVKSVVSFNTMIVGYCDNGEISKARELFDQMELVGIKKDTMSWNSMMSGYVDNCMLSEALSLFRHLCMQEGIEADSFTVGSALTACADLASLRQGREVHSVAIVRGLQSNPFVGGALVEMYCNCKDLVSARMAFDAVTGRDVAIWNSLISGYARCNKMENVYSLLEMMKMDGLIPDMHTWNGIIAGLVESGLHEAALQLFSEMQTSSMKPDVYTVGIILPACAGLATIERGKQVHAYSIRSGYDRDVYIGATLMDMYAKCGSMRHACLVYNRILNPDLVCQNVMLAGYAMHGHGEEGIAFFLKMLMDGIKPDAVTFLSALSSCVHAGSIELGYEYFDMMGHYNIEPTVKHYTCVVDLLSRAGHLSEAYGLINKMPVEPDSVMWGALLGSCVIHGNVEIGNIAAEKLIDLEPDTTGNYVLLANLYAYAERWNDLARIRQIIKDKGMHKSPGCSWIEDRELIHVFLACDKSHKRTGEIYATLDSLIVHMNFSNKINNFLLWDLIT